MQNKLTTPEELQERVSMLSDRIDTLKNSMRGKSNRMKELDELLRMVQFYTEGKPIADKLATIKERQAGAVYVRKKTHSACITWQSAS